ncbi:MAG: hypothetical protein ABUL58_00560, partial [Steroidobacter sp.]
LAVSNPVSADPSAMSQLKKHSGNGIALDNIRQRLELAWPGHAQVELHQDTGTYRVELYFPFQNRTGLE